MLQSWIQHITGLWLIELQACPICQMDAMQCNAAGNGAFCAARMQPSVPIDTAKYIKAGSAGARWSMMGMQSTHPSTRFVPHSTPQLTILLPAKDVRYPTISKSSTQSSAKRSEDFWKLQPVYFCCSFICRSQLLHSLMTLFFTLLPANMILFGNFVLSINAFLRLFCFLNQTWSSSCSSPVLWVQTAAAQSANLNCNLLWLSFAQDCCLISTQSFSSSW